MILRSLACLAAAAIAGIVIFANTRAPDSPVHRDKTREILLDALRQESSLVDDVVRHDPWISEIHADWKRMATRISTGHATRIGTSQLESWIRGARHILVADEHCTASGAVFLLKHREWLLGRALVLEHLPRRNQADVQDRLSSPERLDELLASVWPFPIRRVHELMLSARKMKVPILAGGRRTVFIVKRTSLPDALRRPYDLVEYREPLAEFDYDPENDWDSEADFRLGTKNIVDVANGWVTHDSTRRTVIIVGAFHVAPVVKHLQGNVVVVVPYFPSWDLALRSRRYSLSHWHQVGEYLLPPRIDDKTLLALVQARHRTKTDR